MQWPSNHSFCVQKFFRSARSLTKSCTPPLGSFLAQRMASFTARQPRGLLEGPFLAAQASTEPEPTSRVKPMLSVVSFFVTLRMLIH